MLIQHTSTVIHSWEEVMELLRSVAAMIENSKIDHQKGIEAVAKKDLVASSILAELLYVPLVQNGGVRFSLTNDVKCDFAIFDKNTVDDDFAIEMVKTPNTVGTLEAEQKVIWPWRPM